MKLLEEKNLKYGVKMLIPQNYIEKRAEQILNDKFLRPLICMIAMIDHCDLQFFLTHERNSIKQQIINYLED
jgi:hypothetical protein